MATFIAILLCVAAIALAVKFPMHFLAVLAFGLVNKWPILIVPLIIGIIYVLRKPLTPTQILERDHEESVRRAEVARDKAALHKANYGPINSKLFCRHCNIAGHVRATGVAEESTSRKSTGIFSEDVWTTERQRTQHHCDKCGTTWLV